MSRKLLREWQERLGLQDWRIEVVDNLEPKDMAMDGVAGCAVFQEVLKAARIEIVNPKYYEDKKLVPFDYEKTLVHELLHLKLALIQNVQDDLQERYVHQIIDDLARALVDAKGCGENKKKKGD